MSEPRALLLTTMKNEGPFILDWIAHHRVAGFDHALVYTNDCEDGTDRILDALADEGLVTRLDNPYERGRHAPQRVALKDAPRQPCFRRADWVLPCDVDEYVNIHTGSGTWSDLVAACPDANMISLTWRNFGNAGIAPFRDEPVTEQFTRCAPLDCPKPGWAWGFKTAVRSPMRFERLNPHRPVKPLPRMQAGIVWVNGSGQPMPPGYVDGEGQYGWRSLEDSVGYGLVTLNHYPLRSAESFLVKSERGRTNHVGENRGEQGLTYFFGRNFTACEDHSVLRLAEKTAEERASLTALPGLAALHEEACAWHRTRAAALREEPEFAALYAAITDPGLQAWGAHMDRIDYRIFKNGPDELLRRTAPPAAA